jgi:hypothetical protein
LSLSHNIYRRLFISILFVWISHSSVAQKDSAAVWSFSLSSFFYFVPHDVNSASLIGYAKFKRWHLEARYNYEDRNTVSVFGGYRFETGKKFQFAATPMLGLIVGNTDAIAPGLELEASYWRLVYYSETEYVIDFSARESNFLYVWGDLTINPVSELSLGLSYQRTRLYQTEFDVQLGMLAKYRFGRWTPAIYYFNPFTDNDFLIFALSVDF